MATKMQIGLCVECSNHHVTHDSFIAEISTDIILDE